MATSDSEGISKYLTPIAVIVGAAVIGLAIMFSGSYRGTSPNDPNAAPTVNVDEIKTDSPTVGDQGAPATIAVFYDYQCPYCKQFELAVVPQLMEKYVATGQAKIVYKDFQFLGEDSITAALFGRALYELYPDQFHAWSAAMANNQSTERSVEAAGLAAVQEVARGIQGIDVARVTALMEEKRAEYMAAIEADYEEGTALGITGTPTVVVGDQLLTGLSPAQFQAAISAELDEQLQ